MPKKRTDSRTCMNCEGVLHNPEFDPDFCQRCVTLAMARLDRTRLRIEPLEGSLFTLFYDNRFAGVAIAHHAIANHDDDGVPISLCYWTMIHLFRSRQGHVLQGSSS